MSQSPTRFLACNAKRASLTAYYRLLIHYNSRHIRESWASMFWYCSLKRLRMSSFQLSCDWHLWTYRPFTSFYHATSIEPRQNRKPCGQLSSLASEPRHRTTFSKLMNIFWDLHNLYTKLYRSHIERNSTGVLGLNMFSERNSKDSESLVILRSAYDKATNNRKLPIHKMS